MDAGTIEKVLIGIGAERVRARGMKITCCCVMAPWTHRSKRDTNPSMVVYVDGKRGPTYGCLACHETGTLIDLLLFLRVKKVNVTEWIQVLDGDRPIESAKIIERRMLEKARVSAVQVTAPAQSKHVDSIRSVALEDGRVFYDYLAVAEADKLEAIPEEVYAPYARARPAYALARGITEETIAAFGLGDDRDMERMLFPVRDRRGRLVAISGRLYATRCVACGDRWVTRCDLCGELGEEHEEIGADLVCGTGGVFKPLAEECIKCGRVKPPKYLHSKGFKRNLVLYGEHLQDEAADGRVYVVEGNIDTVMMWQNLYRPVVGILGSYPGEPQIEKIIARWRRVIVVGDGDQSGQDLALHIKRMIADRIPMTSKVLDEGRDPGDMSRAELETKLGPPPKLISAS